MSDRKLSDGKPRPLGADQHLGIDEWAIATDIDRVDDCPRIKLHGTIDIPEPHAEQEENKGVVYDRLDDAHERDGLFPDETGKYIRTGKKREIRLEFGDIILAIAVGIHDIIILRGPKASLQGGAIPPIRRMMDDPYGRVLYGKRIRNAAGAIRAAIINDDYFKNRGNTRKEIDDTRNEKGETFLVMVRRTEERDA